MAVADFVPINWALARNPFNWVIVLLMVVIAAIAFNVVADYHASLKSTGE